MFKGIVETYINKLGKKTSESPMEFEPIRPSKYQMDALPTELQLIL